MIGDLNTQISLKGKVSNDIQLKGKISQKDTLKGVLGNTLNITGKLTLPTLNGTLTNNVILSGVINLSSGSYQIYNGDYEITPKIEKQVLNTKNKAMIDDVHVNKIPYFETSNDYGKTIYIGSEVIINGN